MKRRLFPILAAASLLVFMGTSLMWLKYAYRADYNFGDPPGLVGHYNQVTPAFPRFKLVAYDGFQFTTFHPRPAERGPEYLTTEYMEWEKPFRRRTRNARWLGFWYSYWAIISSPGNPNDNWTDFHGYETEIHVRYWFVLGCSALTPLRWLRGHTRRRRAARAGACAQCGYDLRASTGRCPECGAVVERGRLANEGEMRHRART